MAAMKKRLNLWVALGLIVANLFTWGRLLLAAKDPHVAEPIKDPEVQALLDYIRSGDHSGETWEVTLTELEAEQTITWYLNRYPQIPFAYPEIHITPESISGEGDVNITGLHFHVSGEARVTLEDGLPVVEILDLSLPLPGVADYNSAEFGTAPAPLTCPDALFYTGWYSFGNYNDVFTWVTGPSAGTWTRARRATSAPVATGGPWH